MAKNYCSVSLLSVVSKVCEKVVHNRRVITSRNAAYCLISCMFQVFSNNCRSSDGFI